MSLAHEITSSSRQHAKRDVERARMLEELNAIKQQFDYDLQRYYDRAPLTPELQHELSEKIYEMVNQVEAIGQWDESLFLRNLINPFREVRAQAKERMDQLKGLNRDEAIASELHYSCAEDERLIYILLFQNQGYNIKRWEQLLRSLELAIIGRPIYIEEDNVQHVISRKIDNTNNAYAVAKVSKNDILLSTQDSELRRQDCYGYDLLTLEQGCLKSDHILGFVYQDLVYRWHNSRLKLI